MVLKFQNQNQFFRGHELSNFKSNLFSGSTFSYQEIFAGVLSFELNAESC